MIKEKIKALTKILPKNLQATALMNAFGLTKVPLLFITSPRVKTLTDSTCEVEIPFTKIVKNHLGSMYFGALAIGADTCIGMLAMDKIYQSGENISLIFKNFQADFVKRAEGKTVFICNEGDKISRMIEQCIQSNERISEPIRAIAQVNGEDVAKFILTLSVKKNL